MRSANLVAAARGGSHAHWIVGLSPRLRLFTTGGGATTDREGPNYAVNWEPTIMRVLNAAVSYPIGERGPQCSPKTSASKTWNESAPSSNAFSNRKTDR